jgi:hypothetical protein
MRFLNGSPRGRPAFWQNHFDFLQQKQRALESPPRTSQMGNAPVPAHR